MGRLALVTRLLRNGALFALLGLALTVPQVAVAEAPCSQRVRLDWAADGVVDKTYPVACYQEAIENLPIDLELYSSAEDDIRRALQSVVSATGGKGGAKPVGNAPASVAATEDGDSIPVPLLVLGGVALLLIAAGAFGVARRRGGGDRPGTP